MKTDIEIRKCRECGAEFEAHAVYLFERRLVLQQACEPCCEVWQRKHANNETEEQTAAWETAFWQIVPPLFKGTDIKRLNADAVRAVNEWKYTSRGIGLRGSSGTGKTRCAVILLKRQHDKGRKVGYLKATNLTRCALDMFSDDKVTKAKAHTIIQNATKCEILLLDDIGKGRLSPSAEECLYSILDTRSEGLLPTIWTTNANSQQLHDMMSEDRGDAIIRRLSDFSIIVNTD